jgi:hypothetical protein
MGTQPTPISGGNATPAVNTPSHFFANYKTTLCGLAGAALLAVQTYNGGGGWKGYVGAGLIAVCGALMKDFNV